MPKKKTTVIVDTPIPTAEQIARRLKIGKKRLAELIAIADKIHSRNIRERPSKLHDR